MRHVEDSGCKAGGPTMAAPEAVGWVLVGRRRRRLQRAQQRLAALLPLRHPVVVHLHTMVSLSPDCRRVCRPVTSRSTVTARSRLSQAYRECTAAGRAHHDAHLVARGTRGCQRREGLVPGHVVSGRHHCRCSALLGRSACAGCSMKWFAGALRQLQCNRRCGRFCTAAEEKQLLSSVLQPWQYCSTNIICWRDYASAPAAAKVRSIAAALVVSSRQIMISNRA
jgi:hypothetical protein